MNKSAKKKLEDKVVKSLNSAKTTVPSTQPKTRQKDDSIKPNYARVSVSLFEKDKGRLDEIVGYMHQKGYRLNTSQAIKIALRSVKIDSLLVKSLEQVNSEDQRTSKRRQ